MPKSSPQKLAYMKRYNKENPEKRKRYARAYYKKRRDMFLWAQMKNSYGPGVATEWHKRITEQVGLCKICGEQGIGKTRQGLEYDHDHLTGKCRGLLCGRCNKAIGMLGDNEEGLLKALAYIRGT